MLNTYLALGNFIAEKCMRGKFTSQDTEYFLRLILNFYLCH